MFALFALIFYSPTDIRMKKFVDLSQGNWILLFLKKKKKNQVIYSSVLKICFSLKKKKKK